MLTRKQYELLTFIDKTLRDTGISPSYDEMKEALDLKSKSGIHRLITGLEERGFIRRLPHRARALEVLRLPENRDGAPALPSKRRPGFQPNVIRGAFKGDFGLPGAVARADSETLQLPLYGRIAAGTPIEALRDTSLTVDVPAGMLSADAEHYALEVEGDSMIDAGIHDGDTVIIERAETAHNGSIVVALVENSEVTLKRLRRKGGSIALEPANKAYETRIFGPDQVKIQGRLIALMRSY
ncbi:MAG: transcriptional repressor LexA [Rhodospirillaceae bacterium]